MRRIKLLVLTLLVLLFGSLPVAAGDFDGSRSLVLAVTELHECIPGDDCERVLPEEIALPRFFTIDFKEKKIEGTTADGTVRTTKIERLEHEDGKLILQGGEGGKGWSIEIVEETGKAVMAVASEGAGFIGFGACLVR